MNPALSTLLIATAMCSAWGEAPAGGANALAPSPTGWQCGSTGGGSPKWTLEKEQLDGQAIEVLKQSGAAPYPWCVKPDVKMANGFVEVRFKALGGHEDQAGGVIWRWKDDDNYYVARANALENNLSLYYTSGGTRHTLQYMAAPVAPNSWPPIAMGTRPDAPAPASLHAPGPRVKTCLTSSWLHLLKGRSLLKTQGDSLSAPDHSKGDSP